jgi:hypothetical protein
MFRVERIWAGIGMLTLAVACASGENTSYPKQTPIDTAAPGAATALPPASVLIAHRVADYNAWKSAFDEHMQARKDASCLGHYLKRGIDDTDMVYIYCLASNVDRLRAFLESTDLAEAMKEAGVQGVPEITLMKPISRNLVSEKRLFGIIVMHSVEDYGSWRVEYDQFDEVRRASGIVGHAVSQEFGNPNHVIVYHQAEDLAALHAFVDSAELANAMQDAGVVGDPDIRFIQIEGFAEY